MAGALMGRYIIKPERDVNFYVEWSTVVDAPTAYGTRKQFLKYLDKDGPKRMERADRLGTSAIAPFVHHWDDSGMIYEQQGWLKRENLRALCDRLIQDENADVSDLLTPFED